MGKLSPRSQCHMVRLVLIAICWPNLRGVLEGFLWSLGVGVEINQGPVVGGLDINHRSLQLDLPPMFFDDVWQLWLVTGGRRCKVVLAAL